MYQEEPDGHREPEPAEPADYNQSFNDFLHARSVSGDLWRAGLRAKGPYGPHPAPEDSSEPVPSFGRLRNSGLEASLKNEQFTAVPAYAAPPRTADRSLPA